jgi:hypothetical protein
MIKIVLRAVVAASAIMLVGAGAAAQSDKRLTTIRADVAAIDKSLAKYKKETRDIPDISTEGAEATYYRSGTEIKKISVKIYGETFKGTSVFYFRGADMIFQYDRVQRYDTQIGLRKPVRVVRIEQYRSYFDEVKLFRLQIGTKLVKPAAEEFVEQEKSSLKTVNSLLHPET